MTNETLKKPDDLFQATALGLIIIFLGIYLYGLFFQNEPLPEEHQFTPVPVSTSFLTSTSTETYKMLDDSNKERLKIERQNIVEAEKICGVGRVNIVYGYSIYINCK